MNKKTKNNWQDRYSKKAKYQGYPARSIYKLKEIQERYKILKKNDKVLDLGCAPGSWMLYISEIIGPKGLVIGVDQKPLNIDLPSNAEFHQENIEKFMENKENQNMSFDSILSDLSPKTTGIKITDAARSRDLGDKALSIAKETLTRGRFFVCKFLEGPEFDEFLFDVKKEFKKVKNFKPKSSRKKSKEIFIIGMDKK